MKKFLKNLSITSFCFFYSLYGSCLSSESNYYVISLGLNCMPALHASHHGLRSDAFPFDWNYTSFESLISLIKNDFEDFCELKYLQIVDRSSSDAVLNTKHGFVIHHTFQPSDWDNGPNGLTPLNQKAVDHFEEIKSMYQRRIERFIKIVNSGVLIYFFRLEDIDYTKAHQLYALLKEKYPLSNFFLICLHERSHPKVNQWTSPNERILHFYLNPTDRPITSSTPEHPHECFTKVFSELGLLKKEERE